MKKNAFLMLRISRWQEKFTNDVLIINEKTDQQRSSEITSRKVKKLKYFTQNNNNNNKKTFFAAASEPLRVSNETYRSS